MSKIAVDREAVVSLFKKFENSYEDVREAMSEKPGAADAGEASNEVGVIVAAIAELAEKVMIAGTGLTTVGIQVVDELLAGDDNAAQVFTKIEKMELS